MEQNQALQVLISAVNIAQSKGAFTLQEAKVISDAIEVFTKKPEPKVEEPPKGNGEPEEKELDKSE